MSVELKYIISAVFALVVVIIYLILSKKSYQKVLERLEAKGERRKIIWQKLSRVVLAYIIFNFAFGVLYFPLVFLPVIFESAV